MLLPVGSVVYLENGDQKIIILNRGVIVNQNNQEVFFDYTGAIYPEGLNPKQVYYFNQEDIDQVVFQGYVDDDERRFTDLYKKWVATTNLKKGYTQNN